MRRDPDLKARLVPCPKCGAAPGDPCADTRTGRPFGGTVHRERMKAPAGEGNTVSPTGGRASHPQAHDPQAAWRKAIAGKNRAQRNQRGKRPSPPITGVRKAAE